MKDQDIRWEQRLYNFNKALAKLDQAVTYIKAHYFTDQGFNEELMGEGDDIIKD